MIFKKEELVKIAKEPEDFKSLSDRTSNENTKFRNLDKTSKDFEINNQIKKINSVVIDCVEQ